VYLLYADESGDTGLTASPTNYFILSGLVVHETRWRTLLDDIVAFRQHLRATKGLKLREEIHAAPFITNPGPLVRIKRNDRLDILKQCLDFLGNRSDISICTVVVNKTTKAAGYDVFESAWQALIQRFENTMQHRNYPGSFADQRGLVLPDNTDGGKLTGLIRRMRHYNPVPNNAANQAGSAGYRNLRLQFVIEDPFLKDSAHSFLHQLVDVVAYSARQLYEPNAYMRRKQGHNFYARLRPVLNPHANRAHALHLIQL
jgi:hypothetical protein